jgi:DNA-binding GntR family transcriptional regulator
MSPPLIALQRLIGFADLIREQGHEVTYTPSLRVTDQPSAVVVEALAISADTECYEIERLLFADGQPAVWAVDVFPVSSFVRKLDFTDATVPRSPFDIDSNLFIQPIDHAAVEILPQSAGKELVEKLGLEPKQPCILLREVHYSELGTALGFSAIYVNDLFVRFELIRRRERL